MTDNKGKPQSRKKRWSLDPAEVSQSGRTGNSSGRQRAAQSRVLDVTEATITLLHRPTGIEVSGSVPPGHYARHTMRQQKDELYALLFDELERLVAKQLRVAGR